MYLVFKATYESISYDQPVNSILLPFFFFPLVFVYVLFEKLLILFFSETQDPPGSKKSLGNEMLAMIYFFFL